MNYGPVWIDLQGTELLPEEKEILQHPNTGALLLFTKNYVSKAQITELVQAAREAAGKEILVGVDHEGGRIWRFGEDFTRPPAAELFGQQYQADPKTALHNLSSAGEVVANELIECGIDLTFAPVLDINHGVSKVITDRSYSSDPQIVTACARAFIQGLRSQGMGSIGKHFPGHGGCSMDSHFSFAKDTRSMQEIEDCDLQPFAELSSELAGVMPAHVVYEQIDPEPAGFSSFWLQDILRDKIGFTGAIISDCLSMQGSGFADDMAAGAMRALQAGCDMVIATQQSRDVLAKILDNIKHNATSVQEGRISNLAAEAQEA